MLDGIVTAQEFVLSVIYTRMRLPNLLSLLWILQIRVCPPFLSLPSDTSELHLLRGSRGLSSEASEVGKSGDAAREVLRWYRGWKYELKLQRLVNLVIRLRKCWGGTGIGVCAINDKFNSLYDNVRKYLQFIGKITENYNLFTFLGVLNTLNYGCKEYSHGFPKWGRKIWKTKFLTLASTPGLWPWRDDSRRPRLVSGYARMPNWSHRHGTPLPEIASLCLHLSKGGTLWGRQPFCPHFSTAYCRVWVVQLTLPFLDPRRRC